MGSTDAAHDGWALEVVRGRDAGRTYALNGSEVILGNALKGASGIDLADQEGSSPRRMAARQASLEFSTAGLVLRDLDSPGGTFVNRQRVLSGQARPLSAGDLIQLGGVQLRVIRRAPPAPIQQKSPTRPTGGPLAFTLRSGPVCRSWDDFLIIAAQRWGDLRDELTTGRLAAYLATIGRADLAPDPTLAGNPDERLDAWLGSLPTDRPSRAELEVFPLTIDVRTTGGGLTRRKLTITNTGHRLLRSTVRIEPAGTPWLAIAGPTGTIVTVDASDLPIEIRPPDDLTGRLSASIVIASNGGTQRVAVTLGPPSERDVIPEGTAVPTSRIDWGLRDRISRLSVARRLIGWSGLGLAGRLLIGLAARVAPAGSSAAWPDLRGPALMFAALGALAGLVLAVRRGERRDLPTGAFAGAFAGLLVSALAVAACRSVEPSLGVTLGHSLIAAALLWAILGAALAGVSAWIVPYRAAKDGLS